MNQRLIAEISARYNIHAKRLEAAIQEYLTQNEQPQARIAAQPEADAPGGVSLPQSEPSE